MKILEEREKYENNIVGLQFVALEILKEFDKICRKNNIEYWLDAGTLLGAVRHKGFIPWDDDIDVCINKLDKEKVIKVLKEELPFYLYLDTEFLKLDEERNFLKIKDRYSNVEEVKSKVKLQRGIWIDIFPMTEIYTNKYLNFFISKIPANLNNTNDSELKKKLRKIFWQVLSLFKFKDKGKLIKAIYKKCSNKKIKEYLIYMDGRMWWNTYEKKWIYPLKELEFEGHKFFVPNDYDSYLKYLYGKDYMKIPPKEKRITHNLGINLFKANNHPESLKWEDRKIHYQKYVKEREER